MHPLGRFIPVNNWHLAVRYDQRVLTVCASRCALCTIKVGTNLDPVLNYLVILKPLSVYDAVSNEFKILLATVSVIYDLIEILKLERVEKRLKRQAVERLVIHYQNLHSVEPVTRC